MGRFFGEKFERILRGAILPLWYRGHRNSHNVVYQTARTDLLDLHARGVLEKQVVGKKLMFGAVKDLTEKLRKMGKRLSNN